jgi:hypothetical protein
MSKCISSHGEYSEHTGTDEYCEWCGDCNHDAIRRSAKAEALRDFADAHRMPWTIFQDKDGNPVTVSDLMRETANNYLGKETRNA